MRINVLAACIATTLLAPPAQAQADVKAGVDAWERGEFDAAAKQWRPLAMSGDADAQFNLAQAYRFGRGVPMDLKQAEEWYRRAALQGHVQAENNLGLIMFQNGDRANAMPYIRRSADRGDARAQYVLGTAHFNGDLAEKDWPRAYAYMVRASSAGLDKASSHLAQMDKFISLEERQRGLVLGRSMEERASKPQLALQEAPAPFPSAPAAQAERKPLFASGRNALPPPPRRAEQTPVQAVDLPPSMANDVGDVPPPILDLPSAAPPAPIAPAYRSSPRPTPAISSGYAWRVQLGAFSQESNARALWASSKKQIASLNPLQPYLVKAGGLTRLQAGPLRSKAEAERLCATLRAHGSTCLIVAP